MTVLRHLIAGFILTVLSVPAIASQPYVEKIKMLTGPAGEKLVLEKLYADDGFDLFHPVSVQLKNQNGAVVAFMPVAIDASVYCPSLLRCIVFPTGFGQFFTNGWQLDADSVDYTLAADSDLTQKNTMDRTTGTDYKMYLAYPNVTEFHGAGLGNPLQRLGAKGFAPSDSTGWFLLSPLFILRDSTVIYPLITAAVWGCWYYRKRKKTKLLNPSSLSAP